MDSPNQLPENIFQLVTYPDARLEQRSEECTEADLEYVKKIIKPMSYIMMEYNGIGLAAVQMGVLKRVAVLLTGGVAPVKGKFDDVVTLINPEVIESSEEKETTGEGCLSLPRFNEQVERPINVVVKYRDLDWQERTASFDGIEARCILHEIDHMNGILQVKKFSPMVQQMYYKKLAKGRKNGKITV